MQVSKVLKDFFPHLMVSSKQITSVVDAESNVCDVNNNMIVRVIHGSRRFSHKFSQEILIVLIKMSFDVSDRPATS